MKKPIKSLLIAGMLLSMSFAYAGQTCESRPMELSETQKALSLSSKVIDALNNYGDDNAVFLVGRRGQNLDKYNQQYSHGAFVYKKEGIWTVAHELNTCATDSSSIYEQGLGQFFLDSMYKYETIISAIKEPYAQKVKTFVSNKKTLLSLHTPKYNLLSYPFSQKYQNSNVWLLETFIGATQFNSSPSRAEVQSYLKKDGFTGTILEIDAATRLGARISKANIAFDDQPFGDRMSGKIVTVTYDNMLVYFSNKGWIDKSIVLK